MPCVKNTMLTENQIEFLNKICIGSWYEDNNYINVNGSVDISYLNLTDIPVKFGKVYGYFDCDFNQLTSLHNGPEYVSAYFSCRNNMLTNLIGSPTKCTNYYCSNNNKLNSLIGINIVNGILWCTNSPNIQHIWGYNKNINSIRYDEHSEDINKWIKQCANAEIVFPFSTLEKNIQWIKDAGIYEILPKAPKEIIENFLENGLKYIFNYVKSLR